MKNFKGGYTLVEIIFYIALFFILTFAVISSLITMTRAFRETTVQTDLVQGSFIIERISREIRRAYGINFISANDLKLNTKDELDNNKTMEFLLLDSNIQLLENNIFIDNLNTPNILITALSFTQITTPVGKAVKIDLSVKSARDSVGRIENFYDTVVLRGNYGG